MRFFLFLALLLLPTLAWAQPLDDAHHEAALAIGLGELRLDGSISAVLEPNLWQLDALSWTSLAGETTIFEAQKTKPLRLAAGFRAHMDGQSAPITPEHIQVGMRVAVVGRNLPDGALEVRELVLFQPDFQWEVAGAAHSVSRETARLCSLAQRAFEVGDLPESLKFSNRALQEAPDGCSARLALRWRVVAHAQAREFSAELDDARRLQQSARTDSDQEEEAWALYEQGQALSMLQQPEAALKCYRAALALHPHGPIITCEVRYEIAGMYIILGRNDEAIATYEVAIPLCRHLGRHDLLADALMTVAALQAFKRDPALAASIDDETAEARRELPLISQLPARAAAKEKLARLLWYRGDHEGAQAEVQEACADYTAAARLPEAAHLRAALSKWQAGASPYAEDKN